MKTCVDTGMFKALFHNIHENPEKWSPHQITLETLVKLTDIEEKRIEKALDGIPFLLFQGEKDHLKKTARACSPLLQMCLAAKEFVSEKETLGIQRLLVHLYSKCV